MIQLIIITIMMMMLSLFSLPLPLSLSSFFSRVLRYENGRNDREEERSQVPFFNSTASSTASSATCLMRERKRRKEREGERKKEMYFQLYSDRHHRQQFSLSLIVSLIHFPCFSPSHSFLITSNANLIICSLIHSLVFSTHFSSLLFPFHHFTFSFPLSSLFSHLQLYL